MSSNQDWRIALQEWLQKNPKVMPDDLKQLREEFVKSFPIDKLSEMTLDQYAAGRHNQEIDSTFCHWIEFKTGKLGGIRGGGIAKFGIYWSANNQNWKWNQLLQADNAESAFQKIKNGLIELIHAAELRYFDDLDKIGDQSLGNNKNALRAKPLYLYFPNEFLPISNQKHLDAFLKYFDQAPKSGLHAKNRQLLELLRRQIEFDGFDTLQMMNFLYNFLPQNQHLDTAMSPQTPDISFSKLIENIIHKTQNIILYGSPGTGKTYTVSQFAYENHHKFVACVKLNIANLIIKT